MFFHTQIKCFHSVFVCLPFVYIQSNLVITSWKGLNILCLNKTSVVITYEYHIMVNSGELVPHKIWHMEVLHKQCYYNQVQMYLEEYATIKGPYIFVTSLQHIFMSNCQFLVYHLCAVWLQVAKSLAKYILDYFCILWYGKWMTFPPMPNVPNWKIEINSFKLSKDSQVRVMSQWKLDPWIDPLYIFLCQLYSSSSTFP